MHDSTTTSVVDMRKASCLTAAVMASEAELTPSLVSGAGDILRIIRTRRASTRAEVAALTGWGRAAVAQRLDALVAGGLISPAGELPSTGGRPPALFEFNRNAGLVLAAEIGATH